MEKEKPCDKCVWYNYHRGRDWCWKDRDTKRWVLECPSKFTCEDWKKEK